LKNSTASLEGPVNATRPSAIRSTLEQKIKALSHLIPKVITLIIILSSKWIMTEAVSIMIQDNDDDDDDDFNDDDGQVFTATRIIKMSHLHHP
jgi:hypothetical protein